MVVLKGKGRAWVYVSAVMAVAVAVDVDGTTEGLFISEEDEED